MDKSLAQSKFSKSKPVSSLSESEDDLRLIKCKKTPETIKSVHFQKIGNFHLPTRVVSAICAIMDQINTEHNMKSICRPAVAQWTKRLTRKGQTRVRNWKGANILLSHSYVCEASFSALNNIKSKRRSRLTDEHCAISNLEPDYEFLSTDQQCQRSHQNIIDSI